MKVLVITFLFFATIFASSIEGQQSLAVTIYNNDFAMVKDVRAISFDKGESFLYFTDVSSNIQTETVTFKALKSPSSVRVYQQNFEKNIVNTEGILKKYIDKTIDVYVQLGEAVKRVTGKLLGYSSGYILQTTDGVQIFNNVAGVQFPTLPDGFFTTPTLNWKVWSQKNWSTSCQVAYRTTGFKWSADYSLTLNEQETTADVGGWVTIDNNSGKKYVNAKLKLIAGDVNTISQEIQPMFQSLAMAKNDMIMNDAPSFSQKSFADYHLYTLSRPVTLNQSSQKQVEFIPKVFNIIIDKYHEVRINAGAYDEKNINAKNFVKFLNSKKNGLGIPFPKGIVRVFKEDKDDNSLEFVGEDRINHTPKDQNITISTGNAFDIVSEKIAIQRSNTDNRGSYTSTIKAKITNHKETKAQVILIFSNGYGDNLKLTMLNRATAPQKISSSEYRWKKTLGPNEIWSLQWKQTYNAI